MVERMECLKCGFKWIPRIDKPRMCPHCKRYDWREPKKEKKKDE